MKNTLAVICYLILRSIVVKKLKSSGMHRDEVHKHVWKTDVKSTNGVNSIQSIQEQSAVLDLVKTIGNKIYERV